MKIEALRLFNVKRFAGRGVAIEDIGEGVNVLSAPNEFGKSTSFEALHALFFYPHSSTSSEVRNLRPYSAGNPLVEADVSTASGRFRITKQYYGGRFARIADIATGRLVAQADEAENFISGLIGGGTSGPSGLLWVRQGITGIEKRGKSEEESEKQVRASLLESVQGEVEAITGGRRMTEIQSIAEKALAELLTPTGRPKAGGRYAAAIETRDRLTAEAERLEAEVRALRDALDKRASATRLLSDLDKAEDRAKRLKDIEAAQAAFDAAKAQSEAVKAAEAELRLAQERQATASRELSSFREALESSIEFRSQIVEAERRRADALSARDNALATIHQAKAENEAAEIAAQAARELLDRLTAAIHAREAAERLAKLKAQLEKAEAARRRIEEAQARLASLRISPKAVDDLQAIEIEIVKIVKLKALQEAARPSVSVSYSPSTPSLVVMDGVELNAGEERGYDDRAELAVPGIGTITLRSNRVAPADDRLAAAKSKRQELLVSMGISDLAAARKRQSETKETEAELLQMRAEFALLAPEGLETLRAEIASSNFESPADLELKGNPDQLRAELAEAEARRRHARLRLVELEPMREATSDKYFEAQTTLAALNAKSAQLESILGPEDQRAIKMQMLADKLSSLENDLALRAENVRQLRSTTVDLDSAKATLDRLRSAHDAADKEASKLRVTIAELIAEIRTRSDEAVEEKWRETVEALSTARKRAENFETESAVLQRLCSALQAARSNARELYLQPVMNELRPLLGLLFDDITVTFDEKSLLPQSVKRNGQEEEVERLSGGMREQVSILTRLAFARLLARDGRPAPVILDDALVYSDDDRIEKMFDALHRQSRDQQIIVFSCRQRAFQKLGGNVLAMTDWTP
ncbi:MAG: AAA family ATPase [Rhizobiaceae bacterium]|nr:AAA family ATPase [Rhizobiaceae bacterium]